MKKRYKAKTAALKNNRVRNIGSSLNLKEISIDNPILYFAI